MAFLPQTKVYLVINGRRPGVYQYDEPWQEQVKGFPKYIIKGFKNLNAALAWWRANDVNGILKESEIRKAFAEKKDMAAATPITMSDKKPSDATVIEFRRTPLKIYTDASVIGNAGGWAAIALTGDTVCLKLKGSFKKPTTNSSFMELTAIYKALKKMKKQGWNLNEACVLTDCQYITTHWMKNIRPNDDNKKIWKKVWSLLTDMNMSVCWMKGHAGNIYNEECDRLAREAASEQLKKNKKNKKKAA